MAIQRVPYEPMPFVGEPYRDNGYGRTLAQLMLQRGDQQAALRLRQGDVAAQGWANAGNAINNAVAGWQRDVQINRQQELEAAREARQAEAQGLQIDAARMDLDAKKRQRKGQDTLRAVLPLARRENGVVGYDRDVIQREMEAAGNADMLPDIFSKLDEQEANHQKVLVARRDAVGIDALRVLQGGAEEGAFNSMLEMWQANAAIPERELDAMKKLGKNPEARKQALQAAVQSSPTALSALKAMQEMNKPQLATVAPGASVYDQRNPEAGPVFTAPQEPKTPTNIEQAILQATDPAQRAELIQMKERLTAAGRAPGAQESLQAVMGPDGQSILVPRSQAVGKRPASNREVGRQVTSGDASEIADFNNSLDELEAVREVLKGNNATGTWAQIGAALPNFMTEFTGVGTEAKQKEAVIRRVRQVIGKALEGGVLRKEDEAKYAGILPTISDDPAVVASKLDGLKTALEKRIGNKLDSLRDAGYDTARFEQRAPAGNGARVAGPAVGERRTIQGQLAEWDGKGWKAVR